MMRAVIAPLAGAVVGLALGALIIAASDADPLAAYAALARGALGGSRPPTETVLKATPPVIMGLGLVVAFRCPSGTSAVRVSTSRARSPGRWSGCSARQACPRCC
jgi:ABC-type uncharacterized transport system permease subunit